MTDQRESRTETIAATITMQDAMWGYDPDDFEDDFVEQQIQHAKDKKRTEVLRERAREEIDEDEVRRANNLLWIDQAEVYELCDGHYFEKSDGAWTGSTQRPNFQQFQRKMAQRVADGVPCVDCLSDAVEAKREELADQIDVEVTLEAREEW